MERHQVGDRFEVLVNLANRNVVPAYRELTVKGTGLNPVVDRFFNTYGGISPGGEWLLGHDATGLEVWEGSGVILHGPNGNTVTNRYRTNGKLASVVDGQTRVTRFDYDDADRRTTTTTFPSGAVQTNGLDTAGRHTSITVSKPGAELFKATYRYARPDGTDTDKIQAKTIRGVTTDYAYDALGRLTKAGSGGYGLDNAGNLRSPTCSPAPRWG